MRKLLFVMFFVGCFYSVMFSVANAEASTEANTSKEVIYGDTIKLYFDEREWKLGADNAKTNVFYEYVTDGQTVYNWRELVTLQMYMGLQKRYTAEEFANGYISGLYKSCGDKLAVSVLRNDPADFMLEWKVNGHPQIENQHEIDRIIVGKESLIVIHYVMKTSSLTMDNRARWLEILNKATINN